MKERKEKERKREPIKIRNKNDISFLNNVLG